MTPYADDPLRRSLSTLEGDGASAGFTGRVLEGLAVRKDRRRWRQRLTLMTAGAVILIATAGLLTVRRHTEPTAAEVASETRLLKQEYARLQSDLEALRASARETAPVLYLGGDDEMDLVLDLAPIITRSAPAAVPASTIPDDPYEL